ncbi:BsuPI-related putative proteinase inhibitor [Halovivax sp.]|uniref:BsuPI-related putative proteinase inhibitor n=1 Tax=Halovivax sp. TaxID=1935978 RepID=UPI0025BF3294|nr:BsuPI-related putative proteinase inhibitor [Halovivax sp.]
MTLEATLAAEPTDDGVAFTLTVTNTGSEPVQARFTDAGRADVAVYDGDREVWRFSAGRMYAQVMGSERFEPGEPRSFDAAWRDPEPGSYTAVGELRASDRSCQARTEFTV